MKKMLALFISLSMLFSLTACAGGSSKMSTPTEETVSEETVSADESEDTEVTAPSEEVTDAEEAASDEKDAPTEAPSPADIAGQEAQRIAEGILTITRDNPVGTYKMKSMISGDETLDEEVLTRLENAGMVNSLQLKADGTGVITLYDEPSEFNWVDSKIVVGDSEIPFTLSNGELSMEQDDSSMVFTKVSDEIVDIVIEPIDLEAQAAALSDAAPGTYQLYSMVVFGEEYEPRQLLMMNALGWICAVQLQEDSTGRIYFNGEPSELTWNDSTFAFDGEDIPYTLENKVITLEQDGSVMRFIKISDGIVDFPDSVLSFENTGE